MANLRLVRFDDGSLGLQGTGDPGHRTADFSLYEIGGEGGDPYQISRGRKWEVVPEVEAREYDPDDTDTFWLAQQAIVAQCRAAGISLPEYVD